MNVSVRPDSDDWRAKIEEGWNQAKRGELVSPEEARAWLAEKKAEWKKQREGRANRRH